MVRIMGVCHSGSCSDLVVIRPSVQKMNEYAPQHSRIFREVGGLVMLHIYLCIEVSLDDYHVVSVKTIYLHSQKYSSATSHPDCI